MIRKILASAVMLATAMGCTGIPEGLTPVSGFVPERYLGRWYEIARLDHAFERNLSRVSADYTRDANGRITVTNRGYNEKNGQWKQIEGNARFRETENVGSLKVSFFGPFYGGYHVIDLDRENYDYAMVAGSRRAYLWILARQKTLDPDVYAQLVSKAQAWGFETAQLIRVPHDSKKNEPLKNDTERTDHGLKQQ